MWSMVLYFRSLAGIEQNEIENRSGQNTNWLTQCGANGEGEEDCMIECPLEWVFVFVGGVIGNWTFAISRQLR